MGAETAGRLPRAALAAALGLVLCVRDGVAQEPISAIDWLTERLRGEAQAPPADPAAEGAPAFGTLPGATPGPGILETFPEAPSPGALLPEAPPADPALATISKTVLGAASPDAVGLFPAGDAGLLPGFWGEATRAEAIAAILPPRAYALPSLRDLYRRILTAEFAPPAGSDARGDLLVARIEALIATGAIDQAAALVAQARVGGTIPPALMPHAFDAALLLGEEEAICAEAAAAPGIARDPAFRVFCLMRRGDWRMAVLTLELSRTLGRIPPARAELLARFLDPSLIEDGDALLTLPEPFTPLDFRLLEAVGEAVPTQTLPLPFARADLGGGAGWKAQIEAAERLARAGAIGHGLLFSIYAQGRPSASGGIWRRVAASAAIEAALASGDGDALGRALPEAWAAMTEAELQVPFARQYGPEIAALAPEGQAGALAFRIGLLSEAARRIAAEARPASPEDRLLRALALGIDAELPEDPVARDVVLALTAPMPSAFVPPDMAEAITRGRSALALMRALDGIDAAARGDASGLAGALAFLRAVGLDRIARSAALELLLLERRG
ncbi:MAG: hypothetical protein ACO38S_09230 [Gemmobacter sp.]